MINTKDNLENQAEIDLYKEKELDRRIDILGLIVDECNDDPYYSLNLLQIYHRLYGAQSRQMDMVTVAVEQYVHTILCNHIHKSEKDYYPMFDKQIKKINNQQIYVIDHKNNIQHIPDRWINIGIEEIPVEFKLNYFNDSALKQLNRYINFYKSSYGIAIGRELRVSLPNNICFISLEEIANGEMNQILLHFKDDIC